MNVFFSVLLMVINADLQQAALSGQDVTAAKYVQTFYFLDQVLIFQISAILIRNVLSSLIPSLYFKVVFSTSVSIRSLH